MGSDLTAKGAKSAKKNNNIQVLPHDGRKPVSVERVWPDRLLIEGVMFAGDFFREMALPDPELLYAIKRDEEGVVMLTTIRNVEEARAFFEEVANGTA